MLIVSLVLVSAAQALPLIHKIPPIRPPAIFDSVAAAPCPSIASLIKLPPPSGGAAAIPSYTDLSCSEEDRANIGYIIKTMADHGYVSLLLKSRELKRVGAEIEHVHPFKFLGTIFSNPNLKVCMQKIRTESLKWNHLMDKETGLAGSMERQHRRGQLEIYLNDFAKEVGKTPESLKPFIDKQNWEELVLFLINS